MTKYSLKEWIKKFDNGEFDSHDRETQVKAGWHDWFCQTKALRNKTYRLAPKVKKIAKSPRIDAEKVYVLFKNNMPMHGSLYDDFRICDIESNKVIYTIVPSNGHSSRYKASIVAGMTDCKKSFADLVIGTWKDVLNYFQDPSIRINFEDTQAFKDFQKKKVEFKIQAEKRQKFIKEIENKYGI